MRKLRRTPYRIPEHTGNQHARDLAKMARMVASSSTAGDGPADVQEETVYTFAYAQGRVCERSTAVSTAEVIRKKQRPIKIK